MNTLDKIEAAIKYQLDCEDCECKARRQYREALAKLPALRKQMGLLGVISPCPNCDGSGKNQHGDCCRIAGHAKECACLLCEWKNAYYRLEREQAQRIAELEAELSLTKSMLGVKEMCATTAGLEVEQLRAAIEEADAILGRCRHASREGCNCDVHATHRILRAALAGSPAPAEPSDTEFRLAALDIWDDCLDRRGIKWECARVSNEVRDQEIIPAWARIIRAAMRKVRAASGPGTDYIDKD